MNSKQKWVIAAEETVVKYERDSVRSVESCKLCLTADKNACKIIGMPESEIRIFTSKNLTQ